MSDELLSFVKRVARSDCENYGDCRFYKTSDLKCFSCAAKDLLDWRE